MGETSGSQGNWVLILAVGAGERSGTVEYLGPTEVDFSEAHQIQYLSQ